jgi:hypothetical protein
MSAASLRAGTMTVSEGLSKGLRSYCCSVMSGMLGRPRAAVNAFHVQAKAMSQETAMRANWKGWVKMPGQASLRGIRTEE